MKTFTASFDGTRGTTVYELSDTAVVARSQLGETTAKLRDVSAVNLNVFQDMGFCELKLQTGGSFHVNSGSAEHGAAADYVAFVRALHEQLAATGRGVRFVSGSWSLVVVYVAIVAAVAALAALIELDVFTPPAGFAIRSKLLFILAGAGVLVAPFLIAKTRPKSYDPMDLPARALPRASSAASTASG